MCSIPRRRTRSVVETRFSADHAADLTVIRAGNPTPKNQSPLETGKETDVGRNKK